MGIIRLSGKELKRRAGSRLLEELEEEMAEVFEKMSLPPSTTIFSFDETGSQTSSSIKRSIRSATSQIQHRGSDDGRSFTLIVDGHGSRLNDEFTQFAEGN